MALTGLSRSMIYFKMNPNDKRFDADFPTSIKISESSVAWVEHEVEAWIEARITASRALKKGEKV